MNFSECDITDAADIKKTEDASFSDAWSINAVLEELSSEHTICVKASDDGEIAGYAILSFVADEGELLKIAVLPEKRKKGIGQALLNLALEMVFDRGVQSVFLEVREKNKAARTLYEKNGFEQIGVRKKYYGDDNAVLYKKSKEQANDSSGN